MAVTIRSYFGYNKTVSLFSNAPSGISITFALSKLTPPANGNISTTAFISVAKNVAANTYTAFINATDGSIERGLQPAIRVNAISTTTSVTTSTTTVTTTATTTTSYTTTSVTTPTTTSSQSTTATTTQPSEGSDMTLIIILAVIFIIVIAVAAYLLLRKSQQLNKGIR